jgi:transposase
MVECEGQRNCRRRRSDISDEAEHLILVVKGLHEIGCPRRLVAVVGGHEPQETPIHASRVINLAECGLNADLHLAPELSGRAAERRRHPKRGKLVGWVRAASPRSTGQIGAWIASEFGVEYESRSGLVALLHRLGLEYRKPEVIPRHLDETKQRAFIKLYEKLMNALGADEAVLFVDAVHPTHGARAAGCWAAKDEHLAIEQTTGRQRLNIHGAIDLETGRTKMIEAEAIDAASTIKLLAGIEALYSTTALIHVFLDNARYHHAKIVRKWLSQPGRRIALHFVPSYCPHLNPIERLWALMHQHLTHNKTYPTCREFAYPILNFLRDEVPRKWGEFCDSVTDNFRVVLPANFRILA